MNPQNALGVKEDDTRFEQLEDNTFRTIIVKGFPDSATVFDVLKCLEISGQDVQKTEDRNVPEHFFRRHYRTKEKECVITLNRAMLAENCMENNQNKVLDGHTLNLTRIDTKTVLKVDHHSVRISHLPPDLLMEEIVEVFTRDVGDISIGKDGQPDVQFLFKFTKQSIVKITFESAELADKCVARNDQLFSDDFPEILKIGLFEIREKCGSSLAATKDDHEKYNEVPNVVYVRGFPKHFTEDDLSNFVEDWGEVVRVVIYLYDNNMSKGAGTISFAQPADATSCIEKFHGTQPEGWKRSLEIVPFRARVEYNDKENVKLSEHSKKSACEKPKPAKDDQKKFTVVPNVVYVRGFPKHFLEADLSEVVQSCGKIIRVVIYGRDDANLTTGAGTISFAQPFDATSCIEKFNGTKPEGWEHNLQITPFRSRIEYNDEENASKPGQNYECIICFETYDGKDVMNCVPIVRGLGNRETHFTCKDCVSGHAKALCSEGIVAKGGTGIPCGFPGCKRAILRAHLLPLLDDCTKKQLENLMNKMAIVNIKGMKSCKSCEFGLILPNKWKMQFFHCENASCGDHYCRFCQIDFDVHIGKRCRDVEPGRRKERERKKYEEALSRAVIRKCRKCHLAYQKETGCNKMTCSQCGTTQCYVCRKSYIDYNHFGESMGKCALFEIGKGPDEQNLDAVRRRARDNEWLDGVDL